MNFTCLLCFIASNAAVIGIKSKDLLILMHLHVFMQSQEVFCMVRMTFSIPDELKQRMDELPEVNWPEFFKQRLKEKVAVLKELKRRGEL